MNTPSESPKSATPVAAPPRIWLVIGDKQGDNAQVEIIAEALGLPYEIRRVIPKAEFVLGKPRFKPALYHLDPARSDPLEPPWPDLILTIGRRPAMAALWIQQQSGGHSRIALLGRPKRWPARFSLIIVPSQYPLPAGRRVLPLELPLMRNNRERIQAAGRQWQASFADLPRPLTAVLVGGQTKPFRFDDKVARDLLDRAASISDGGTLYLTTSRRTPAAVVAALQEHLPANACLYIWSADNGDNPYSGLLALADRFVVTGDSISMMVEVARLGKPLAIFPLPFQGGSLAAAKRRMAGWLHPPRGRKGPLAALGRALFRLGIVGYSRDLTAIHRLLINRGFAVRLGEPFPAVTGPVPDELPAVVERIRSLLQTGEKGR